MKNYTKTKVQCAIGRELIALGRKLQGSEQDDEAMTAIYREVGNVSSRLMALTRPSRVRALEALTEAHRAADQQARGTSAPKLSLEALLGF